jgi:CHAT domain-containing protein
MPLLHAVISRWTPVVLISFLMALTTWVWDAKSKHHPKEATEPLRDSSVYTAISETKALVEAVLGNSIVEAVEQSNAHQRQLLKISRRPRLTTALIFSAERTQLSRGLQRDLHLTAQAHRRQPRTLTALYNRAGAFERLGMTSAAALRDYEAYLAIDSTSRRADMVLRRLAAVRARQGSVSAMFHDTSHRNDSVVMSQLAEGNPAKALAYIDRERAARPPLHEMMRVAPDPGPSPAELALEYTRIADTLLIWTISRQGIEVSRTVLDTIRLMRTLERIKRDRERGASEAESRPALSLLYEWFVRPVEARLSNNRPLAVVTNREAAVPFAQLYDERRGRSLAQDHHLRIIAQRKPWARVHRSPASKHATVADDPQEVQSLPGAIGLEYARIADTLLIWTISPQDVQVYRTVLDTVHLAQTLNELENKLQRGSSEAEVRPALSILYDWLIRPVETRLGREMPLVVVGDEEAVVPFAALYDARRGRYLVQDHSLRFATSLQEARRIPTGEFAHGVLLIGNPTYDRREHRFLESLQQAGPEVASIVRIYTGATMLNGADATWPALQLALPHAEVVHFAGHAIFTRSFPIWSYLVLAPYPPLVGSGRFTAEQVSKLELRRVRLVVLAACHTARGAPRWPIGFGLSSAFLDAGVGGVVGSTWSVQDQPTAELMVAFHRAYATGKSAPVALRSAQLSMLGSQDPTLSSPSAWASFRYTGR